MSMARQTMESGPCEEESAGPDQDKGRHRLAMFIAVPALCLAGFLLYRTLKGYSLEDIVASLAAIPASRLAGAGAFAAASYLCLTGFDYLALRYVGRPLPYPKAALASFTSLSLGHNIGLAFLSSGAVRYRFYSRWGLNAGQVAKVILFCGVTVGLGLMTLGGAALLIRSGLAQEITGLPRAVVIAIGAACFGAVAGYVALSAFVRRSVRIFGVSFEFPPLSLAILQVVVGSANFACVAACLYHALASSADVSYIGVASIYVIANTTALISHVPGGLGVIESVVIFLVPQGNLIGALVVFRVVYYLVPLAIGGLCLAVSELVFRRRK